MNNAREPIFLARQSYRRRRLGDAAKLIPVIGAILLLMPMLWGGSAQTSGGLIYIFSVWAILIVVIALISSQLAQSIPETDDPDATAAAEQSEE